MGVFTYLLEGAVVPPAWHGPACLYLKLSSGDEDGNNDEEGGATAGEPQVKFKQCTKCMRLLPLTRHYYFVNRREKSGFMSECKVCHKARDREDAQRRYAAKQVLRAGDFERMEGKA